MAVAPEKTLARQTHAALLLTTTSWDDAQVAAAVGVAVNTLRNWRPLPEFQTLLAEQRRATFEEVGSKMRSELLAAGSAIRENRVGDYNLIRDLALGTIEARRKDAQAQLAAWSAFETRKAELIEAVAVCQQAKIETDKEDSQAYALADSDLQVAHAELDRHIRWHGVACPPSEALLGVMARDVKSVGKELAHVWKWDDAPLRTLMAADKQAAEDLGQWLRKMSIEVGDLEDAQVLRLLTGETLEDEQQSPS